MINTIKFTIGLNNMSKEDAKNLCNDTQGILSKMYPGATINGFIEDKEPNFPVRVNGGIRHHEVERVNGVISSLYLTRNW